MSKSPHAKAVATIAEFARLDVEDRHLRERVAHAAQMLEDDPTCGLVAADVLRSALAFRCGDPQLRMVGT